MTHFFRRNGAAAVILCLFLIAFPARAQETQEEGERSEDAAVSFVLAFGVSPIHGVFLVGLPKIALEVALPKPRLGFSAYATLFGYMGYFSSFGAAIQTNFDAFINARLGVGASQLKGNFSPHLFLELPIAILYPKQQSLLLTPIILYGFGVENDLFSMYEAGGFAFSVSLEIRIPWPKPVQSFP